MTFAATLGIAPTSTLRRAPKAAAPAPAFDRPAPYSKLMACWADFMRTDDRDLGAGGMRLRIDAAAEQNIHDQ